MQKPLLPFSDHGRSSTTATARSPQPSSSSYWPRRTTHISRGTASAILFALEEAIRTPFPFTPDKIEENASMADLRGGVGGARAYNGSRTTSGPIPVTQPVTNHDPRPRTPRQILKDREERMTRRRQEEKEEQERVTAELRAAQKAAAGVATGGTTSRSKYSEQPDQGLQTSQGARPDRGSGGGVAPKVRPPAGAQGGGVEAAGSRIPTQTSRPQGIPQRTRTVSQPEQPRPVSNQPARPPPSNTYTQQPQTSQTRLDPSNQGGTTRAQAEPSASTQRPTGGTQQGTTQQTRSGTTSTFPHAFERWETLSSHWEGLTNFWIKRLEGNSAEFKNQPVNQQLARQVTDLAAAGANLFHAVVELQRLRASSERKFQRWFFDTREEREKDHERIAQLEAELNEARRNRSTTATTTDQPSSKVREEVQEQARQEAQQMAEDKIARIRRETEMEIKEKNRELEISKEEARRGWEEIGRMEQENRDRTFSLRRGEPTIVGGVQVVPFMPAGASRQTSTSRGHAGGGLSSHPPQPEVAEPGYTTYDPSRSETDTDPFTENGRDAPAAPMVPTSIPSQPPTSAAAMQAARASASPRVRTGGEMLPPSSAAYETDQPVQAPTSTQFYQQHGAATALHSGELGFPRTTGGDQPAYTHSEGSLEEEGYAEDEHGNPILTRRGPASEGSEEYDVIEQLQRDRILGPPFGPGYGGYSSTSNGSGYPQQPDYSGQGYGRGDWDVPRHHHPTRLSDVPEEDERSRTSPSRASQRSRGLH